MHQPGKVIVSVRHSLLAILGQGPCYGYQLKSEFDRRTGGSWPLNVGQIYNTLDRLERDGLVDKHDIDPDGQIYYEITAAGRATVADWLDSAVPRGSAPRDELAIKLAIAATLPGTDAAVLVERQRQTTGAARRELEKERSATAVRPDSLTAEQLARTLILDSRIEAAEAEMRWLDNSAMLLAQVADSGGGTSMPLSGTPPKRGRPSRNAAAPATDES
ncbi:MAG: hypothetical protein JWQ43_2466 [Glaciihabitans sp.]|nr:hypothetical protein [Glaciihabitans sp.]